MYSVIHTQIIMQNSPDKCVEKNYWKADIITYPISIACFNCWNTKKKNSLKDRGRLGVKLAVYNTLQVNISASAFIPHNAGNFYLTHFWRF